MMMSSAMARTVLDRDPRWRVDRLLLDHPPTPARSDTGWPSSEQTAPGPGISGRIRWQDSRMVDPLRCMVSRRVGIVAIGVLGVDLTVLPCKMNSVLSLLAAHRHSPAAAFCVGEPTKRVYCPPSKPPTFRTALTRP